MFLFSFGLNVAVLLLALFFNVLHWGSGGKRNGQHSNVDMAKEKLKCGIIFCRLCALVCALCVSFFLLRMPHFTSTESHTHFTQPFQYVVFFSLFNSVIRRRMICCSCSYFTVSTGSKSKTDGRKKNHYFFCSQKKNCCDGMDIQCFNVRCVHSVQQDLFHFCWYRI